MYKNFAKFYDRLGWDAYARELWPDFKSYLDKINFSPKTMLDVACGTGIFCICATKDDIAAEGLDISQEMLNKALVNASENNLDIKFYKEDMSNFSISKKYDLITCTFDAINHMLDFNDWIAMFRSVKDHLSSNGYFMFDMNTLKDLNQNWNNISIRKHPNGDYHISKSISFGDTACVTFTAFLKRSERTYEWYEETIREVSFPLNNIEKELKNVGFNDIIFLNRRFETVKEPEMLSRVFILCKK